MTRTSPEAGARLDVVGDGSVVRAFLYNGRALTDNDCTDPLILENQDTGQRHQFPDAGCPLTSMPATHVGAPHAGTSP